MSIDDDLIIRNVVGFPSVRADDCCVTITIPFANAYDAIMYADKLEHGLKTDGIHILLKPNHRR